MTTLKNESIQSEVKCESIIDIYYVEILSTKNKLRRIIMFNEFILLGVFIPLYYRWWKINK